jgi:hypothetical protein
MPWKDVSTPPKIENQLGKLTVGVTERAESVNAPRDFMLCKFGTGCGFRKATRKMHTASGGHEFQQNSSRKPIDAQNYHMLNARLSDGDRYGSEDHKKLNKMHYSLKK